MIRDWPNRLKAVLWGLFWLPTLWVAADYHLIQSNGLEINLLILTVLIQVVPLKHRLMNNLLQLTAALAVLLSFHSIELIISGKWMLLVMQIIRTVLVLSLYFSTLQWITTRWRMLICFIITIVVYGVLDSFGSKLVWDKAALIIFAGLCLLVLQQLEDIRLRRPNVWSYLSEYPGSLGAPIAILICITMVFGMLAPSLPSVISIGSVGAGHSGALSHQQSGSSDSSLSTSSGYSRDDKQLGAGFQFDYSQVIQVDTTQASYLRGETRSFYTGQGWELSKSQQQAPVSSVDADQPLSSDVQLDSSRLQTVDVNQTVTMLTPINYPVIFGAFSISRLRPVQSDPPINLAALHWSAFQAELRVYAQFNYSFPHAYTVVSKVPIVDEAALRTVVKQPDPTIMQDDLQLPAKLPNRVKQLAVTITQNQSTYYDKVKSIEQYLSSNYTYNNLPAPPAPGQDFVDHFLFESKQGYCDHFSTAMVILARSLGIPARWVKGYTAGAVQQTDQEQMLNDSNASTVAEGPGVYTILNSDAHSWVEVYFPGFGWIPFEPTSGFSLPKIVPDSQLVDLPAAAAPAAQTAQKSTAAIATQPLLAAVFLLLIALIIYSLVSRSSLFFNLSYFIQRRRAISRKQRVTLEFRKLVYSMSRKGLLYLAYETMRETFERWAEVVPTLKPQLSDLLSILEKAKYTQADITTAELSQVVELVKRVCNNHGGLGRK